MRWMLRNAVLISSQLLRTSGTSFWSRLHVKSGSRECYFCQLALEVTDQGAEGHGGISPKLYNYSTGTQQLHSGHTSS
ncbi:uncharacterized protein BDV17DRAFT_264930 [Aspergillus undulatus]|uniref:uncharacterized protein n=1 Tax=Aspergillus undulatus TaxID=1810928 RepID=UPI003CCE4BCE